MDRISLLLGSIKCFPISFNTFKSLYVAPDGAGIINYQYIFFFFLRWQGAPWEVKGHALLKCLEETQSITLLWTPLSQLTHKCCP
jgi:hypothetical protein